MVSKRMGPAIVLLFPASEKSGLDYKSRLNFSTVDALPTPIFRLQEEYLT